MLPQPQTEYAPYGPLLLFHFEMQASRFTPRYVPGKTILRSPLNCLYRVESVAGAIVTIRTLNGPSKGRVWQTTRKSCDERLEIV